jgi:hypothetical protein
MAPRAAVHVGRLPGIDFVAVVSVNGLPESGWRAKTG